MLCALNGNRVDHPYSCQLFLTPTLYTAYLGVAQVKRSSPSHDKEKEVIREAHLSTMAANEHIRNAYDERVYRLLPQNIHDVHFTASDASSTTLQQE